MEKKIKIHRILTITLIISLIGKIYPEKIEFSHMSGQYGEINLQSTNYLSDGNQNLKVLDYDKDSIVSMSPQSGFSEDLQRPTTLLNYNNSISTQRMEEFKFLVDNLLISLNFNQREMTAYKCTHIYSPERAVDCDLKLLSQKIGLKLLPEYTKIIRNSHIVLVTQGYFNNEEEDSTSSIEGQKNDLVISLIPFYNTFQMPEKILLIKSGDGRRTFQGVEINENQMYFPFLIGKSLIGFVNISLDYPTSQFIKEFEVKKGVFDIALSFEDGKNFRNPAFYILIQNSEGVVQIGRYYWDDEEKKYVSMEWVKNSEILGIKKNEILGFYKFGDSLFIITKSQFYSIIIDLENKTLKKEEIIIKKSKAEIFLKSSFFNEGFISILSSQGIYRSIDLIGLSSSSKINYVSKFQIAKSKNEEKKSEEYPIVYFKGVFYSQLESYHLKNRIFSSSDSKPSKITTKNFDGSISEFEINQKIQKSFRNITELTKQSIMRSTFKYNQSFPLQDLIKDAMDTWTYIKPKNMTYSSKIKEIELKNGQEMVKIQSGQNPTGFRSSKVFEDHWYTLYHSDKETFIQLLKGMKNDIYKNKNILKLEGQCNVLSEAVKIDKEEMIAVVCIHQYKQSLYIVKMSEKKLNIQKSLDIDACRITSLKTFPMKEIGKIKVLAHCEQAQILKHWFIQMPTSDNGGLFEFKEFEDFNKKGKIFISIFSLMIKVLTLQ